MDQRQSIRHTKHQQRSALSPHHQKIAAQKAAELFSQLSLFTQSHRIAFYLAFNNEQDPAPLLELAEHRGKRCYLPVLHPQGAQKLLFLPYHSGILLSPNRFGIQEPHFDAEKVCFPWDLDVVIIPLVAFDLKGHRLGMGAGFYDRSFAFLAHIHTNKPKLIGYAYECQRVDKISKKPWDIPLDGVVTEKEVYLFLSDLFVSVRTQMGCSKSPSPSPRAKVQKDESEWCAGRGDQM